MLPTGFTEFDKLTGGLPPESVTLIAGTTGGGKSNLSMNLALNMVDYKTVMYVPLEMSEKEMWSRILSRESRIKYERIARAKLLDKEKERINRAYNNLRKKCKEKETDLILHCPEEDIGIGEILAHALASDVDVVVIDYVSLLKGVDGDDAWQQLSNVSRKAKLWAKIHNKRVILLAQLSDEGKVKFSRAMVDHANTCWIWSRPADSDENKVMIRQIKARNHSPAPFYLNFELEYCYVGDETGSAGLDDDMPTPKSSKKRDSKEEERELDKYLDDEEDEISDKQKRIESKKRSRDKTETTRNKRRREEVDDEDNAKRRRRSQAYL